MSHTTQNAAMAPYSGLVILIGEIIAPVVTLIANLLISVVGKLTAPRKSSKLQHGAARSNWTPAPHVAMVLVPGNFMTGPFTHR